MRLSVQLYTVREALANDQDGTLAALKDMGLEYVELAGFNGQSAEQFRKVLDRHGLKVSAGHWGLDQVKVVEKLSREANTLGCRHIILPWVAKESYERGWVEFGKELEPIARALVDRGHTFSYHNHAFEFDPTRGTTFAEMWEQTESFLHAQLDLGWLAYAGEDPAAWVRKLGRRCRLVHLKDFSGDREFHDAEAGTGKIDWDDALAACQETGVEFGAIEMDRTPNEPLISVRRSVEFFQSKGLR